ncbi:LapA family protein [Noviherbaspirillum sp. 1P10PC]|uniref:LapA family protein n=1 Tax=Noviherbaspirillum sp. 1P10PC TaxID=3132292 RepID=UPI0039A02564
MKLRTLLLLLLLLAITLFVALNWPVIIAPTTLSLLVTTVEAPLGLIMLGMLLLLTGAFVVFAGVHQTAILLEARQQAKELQAQRKLADQAEASRISELHQLLTATLQKMDQQTQENRLATHARIDALEQNLRAALAQETTTLSAYIGELEDRLERGAAGIQPLRGG